MNFFPAQGNFKLHKSNNEFVLLAAPDFYCTIMDVDSASARQADSTEEQRPLGLQALLHWQIRMKTYEVLVSVREM